MIVMGDEVRRTQGGNNNAYCQDNETSWFDWTLLAKHADVHRFATQLIARRLLRPSDDQPQPISLSQLLRMANKAWHGVKLNQPDWNPWSHSLALTAEVSREVLSFHVMLNAYWEALDFDLPPLCHGAHRDGAGGSTLSSTLPTTSCPGRRHPAFHPLPIGSRHAPWSCCLPISVLILVPPLPNRRSSLTMNNLVPHVVIVGGGFGGLAAAKALRKAPVHVTLIDRNNHHVFQPLLYQVATSVLTPAQIGSPLRRFSPNSRTRR